MGSFNTTCAVSHASIRNGDKVRLFFLLSEYNTYKYDAKRDSLNKGGQCYPWDDFTIIGGVSIKAEYADYGNYSFNHESIEAQYIHEFITTNYVENISKKGKDYNEIHDHMDVNVRKLSWDKIQRMINSGRLFMSNNGYESNLPFVAMFAVHESVYEIMIGSKEYIDDELNKEIESGSDLTKRKMKRFFNLDAVSDNEDPISGMVELIEKNGIEGVSYKEIVRSVIETDKFLIGMYCHNLMLRPMRTSGQDGDLISEVSFMRKIASAIENIPDKWEDEAIQTKKISMTWQEVDFSKISEMLNSFYSDYLNDEEYQYFSKLIEGKDKIIIRPEDWGSDNPNANYYDYLADIFKDTSTDIHILNK